MSNTLLERCRRTLQDRDEGCKLLSEELMEVPETQKDKVKQELRVAAYISFIQKQCSDLLSLFKDKDGFRRAEIKTMSKGDIIEQFYARYGVNSCYHKKHPSIAPEQSLQDRLNVLVNKSFMKFSGEEKYGKYLDLHQFYTRFLNIKEISSTISKSKTTKTTKTISYRQFLDLFYIFNHVNVCYRTGHTATTRNLVYAQYIHDLRYYLEHFIQRAQPVLGNDAKDAIKQWENEFSKKWEKQENNPNPNPSLNVEMLQKKDGFINVNKISTYDELSAMETKAIRAALSVYGLKKGGTHKQKRKRRRKNNPNPNTQNIKNTKNGTKNGTKNTKNVKNVKNSAFEIAQNEYIIHLLATEMHQEKLRATRNQVEKKLTLTYNVDEEDAERLANKLVQSDDEDDEIIYNPLNLPLGWDGKPIPFWLYVCYWGRRAFDRHFQEWKHSHDMRCLGIPNTKHFHDITVIEDAVALHQKLSASLAKDSYSKTIEYVYSEGNVLDQKTYRDLERQGLL
eukprot:GSMAST32.ASY1.ANO1.2132.1 assembled CDS